MIDWQIIVIATAVVIAYQLIAVRLSASAQPLRLQIAQDGEELLAADDVPEELKRRIETMMSMLFSSFAAWIIFLAMLWLTFTGPFRERNNRLKRDVPHRHHEQIDDLVRSSLACILVNSPLALLLTAVMAFIMLIFAP